MTTSKLPVTERALTQQEADFVVQFVSNGDQIAAYRAAYSVTGLSDRALRKRAYDLKNRPHVKRAIELGQASVSENMMFGIQDVMREWMDIATADPNEIASIRRQCCRHCHGRGHDYQWTERELAAARMEVIDNNLKAQYDSKVKPKDMPNDSGGVGFNFTVDPHPNCPVCMGMGHETLVVHDTTKLKGKAKKLFGGAKINAKGQIEVIYRDQDAALANFAKALGMFAEIVKLQHTMHHKLAAPMPTDPQEASRVYQDLISQS